MVIPCIVIDHRTAGKSVKSLLDSGSEELFVVDLDSLRSRKHNYAVYTSLAKYFDLTVLNFPLMLFEFIDTIIAGASRVVVPEYTGVKELVDFLSYSEGTVINNKDPEVTKQFSSLGGDMFLSETLVSVPYKTVYYYGNGNYQDYVKLDDFPFDAISRFL